MIRLKLDRLDNEQIKAADVLGPARLRKAIADKQDFVWGFTDALHRVFPDRPYDGPLGNAWTIDAARNEYESCQLVIVPASVDMKMAEVFVDDFVRFPAAEAAAKLKKSKPTATIGKQNATIRLVRTARTGGADWPDPLPPAYPIDVSRGRVQSWWLTVHVPIDAQPGTYRSEVSITSMSTGGREGKVTQVPIQLRVRNFSIPTVSRYQSVAPIHPEMQKWQMSHISPHGGTVTPEILLDKDNNLQLDFSEFDKQVEAYLANGKDSFSIGLAYTGGNFAPWSFDWRVPVEGQNSCRRGT